MGGGSVRATLGVVGILLSSCSAGYQKPFEPQAVCTTSGGTTWMLEKARDCSFYEQATSLLISELGMPSPNRMDWQPPIPEDRARALVAQETFWVHDATGFQCQDETQKVGGCELWGTSDAEVTRSGGGALHEMLHAWDEARGVSHDDSFNHVGWQEAGWIDQGNIFYWYQDQQFASKFADVPAASSSP